MLNWTCHQTELLGGKGELVWIFTAKCKIRKWINYRGFFSKQSNRFITKTKFWRNCAQFGMGKRNGAFVDCMHVCFSCFFFNIYSEPNTKPYQHGCLFFLNQRNLLHGNKSRCQTFVDPCSLMHTFLQHCSNRHRSNVCIFFFQR